MVHSTAKGQALIHKIHSPKPRQRGPHTRGRLAAWVVVGKLARALAGPALAGAVHKAVGFVGKAGLCPLIAACYTLAHAGDCLKNTADVLGKAP
ncbi:hypothetical protein A4U49_09855 [Acidithiobacillus ferrivorans]|uniref:hypothetical protein n=1 Tax=Acidithiobacillus ferrivorans TaxID=160808 RepID=UPI0008938876|nr:hypothetical protein [Acidithiobacillus ferrivorans]OFA15981.1 hypothetical protein A4U49_09855 [Acidithiobacillus ferrivorans]